jgi:hypothetical protein
MLFVFKLLTFLFTLSLSEISLFVKIPFMLFSAIRSFTLNATSIRLHYFIYGLVGIFKTQKVDQEKKIG